jgi:hypothetical protein
MMIFGYDPEGVREAESVDPRYPHTGLKLSEEKEVV